MKTGIEMYRQASLMPDLISIGNKVNTGFLAYPPYNNFSIFARLGASLVIEEAANKLPAQGWGRVDSRRRLFFW